LRLSSLFAGRRSSFFFVFLYRTTACSENSICGGLLRLVPSDVHSVRLRSTKLAAHPHLRVPLQAAVHLHPFSCTLRKTGIDAEQTPSLYPSFRRKPESRPLPIYQKLAVTSYVRMSSANGCPTHGLCLREPLLVASFSSKIIRANRPDQILILKKLVDN